MVQKQSSALIGALLVGGLVAAGAAPASARVLERFTYEESVNEVIDGFCGSELQVAYTSELAGAGSIRTRGNRGLEWCHDRFQLVETFTDAGMTVTAIQPNTLNQGHKIVDNGDGTLGVTVLLTGGARLIGSDGKLLAKDSGEIRLLLTVDSESGAVLSHELIFRSTGTNDDFCEAMLAHWGF